MSFRLEEKIFAGIGNGLNVLNEITRSNLVQLYPCRRVDSVYFDSSAYDLFHLSEEGLLPRKKIRIRSYPDYESDFLLETKISSIEGRFKTSSVISDYQKDLYLSQGLLDNDYGHLIPLVNVSYSRSYFSFESIRLTLDTDITYSLFDRSYKVNEPYSVVEVKAPISELPIVESITSRFKVSRFSKFSNAMRALMSDFNGI